jgi:hypothetical protein
MKRREFIACVIVGCFASFIPADPTYSQTTKQAATENTLAAKIKCKDFQKTSDGKWTSSAGTTIGKLDFGSHTFGVGEVNIGGADLATVLSRKCAVN